MTTDEAREAAWREWWDLVVGDDEPGEDTHDPHFNFMGGWDAAKREDEQRIAELVDGLDTVRNALWRYLGGRSARAAAINRAFDASMRALGQSEEAGSA